jgi:DNA repair exonuclease SbcCD ATPase subunit
VVQGSDQKGQSQMKQAPRLDLKSIKFRNLFSYGDYDTEIDLENLGQCLILGRNGAGKSTIPNAILWTMFGSTMHAASPGDNVINEFIGKNCISSVTLKNKDVITRTRNTANHNELMIERDGELALATLSTTPSQQAKLAWMYNLDWRTFVGGSFFTQYNKPWLSMEDTQRKTTIESLLQLELINHYAESAKGKVAALLSQQTSASTSLDRLRDSKSFAQQELDAAIVNFNGFETAKQKRIADAKAAAAKSQGDAEQIVVPDVAALEAKWKIIAEVESAVHKRQSTVAANESVISSKRREMTNALSDAKKFESKSDKVCSECLQPVPADHVKQIASPFTDRASGIAAEIEGLVAANTQLSEVVQRLRKELTNNRPTMTVDKAREIVRQRATLLNNASIYAARAEAIASEENTHQAAIDRLTAKVAEIDAKIEAAVKSVTDIDVLTRHATYISKSYSDRKKIKSFAIADKLDSFNTKLKWYLESFGLEFGLRLTESLSIDYDRRNYKYMCGGERARADLAFMFGIHFLHESIYGPQCNVVLLDEVDSKMDSEGVDCLVEIIRSDISKRAETVLVISHKKDMLDKFPKIVRVHKDKFSTIEYN